MPVPATIHVHVSPEAEARVEQLSMRLALQQMLEKTCELGSDVRGIDVSLMPPCDPGEEPRIVLEVTKANPQRATDPLWRKWRNWVVESFPPQVLQHFNMLISYGTADDRASAISSMQP
jgi:hypothetical protein